jgi:membrane protease YdiL (CAAX protease family)
MGLAIIGIWPLFRAIGAKSFADVGLVKPSGQWGQLGKGFALGIGSFAVVAGVAILGHGRQLNPELSSQFTLKLLRDTAVAMVAVPLLEELLFRGGLMGALRRAGDWRIALVVSSMVYAITHFLNGRDVDPTGPIHWYSGLEVLPKMLRGFTNFDPHAPGSAVPGFFTLTFAGLLLGLAYQRTGNLYFSMGLHSGWVFWNLRLYRVITSPVSGAEKWVWGGDNPTDGLLALGMMAAMFLAMIFTGAPAAKGSAVSEEAKKPK